MREILTSAVVAAIVSGGIALLAPFVTWKIEKWRDQRARRADLAKSWREGIAAWNTEHGNPGVYAYPAGFSNESWYLELRPYLTADEQVAIEGKPTTGADAFNAGTEIVIAIGATSDHFPDQIYKAIHRIETEWGL